MKKYLLVKLMAVIFCSLALICCKEDPAFVTVNPAKFTLESDAITLNVAIESNSKWQSVSKSSWIKVGTTFGEGTSTTNIIVDENTSSEARTGSVTFTTADGSSQSSVSITQAATKYRISVSASNLTFENSASSKTIDVSSTTNWEITDYPSWITLSKKTGNGNSSLTITVTANPNSAERSGEIKLKTSNNISTASISVKQKAANAAISVNPGNIEVASDASSTTIAVTANCEWSASSSASWLTVSPTSGNGSKNITLTASANNNSSSRNCSVTIKSKDGSAQAVINVVQSSNIPQLTVSPASINLGTAATESSFSIKSNMQWTVTSNQTWLTLQTKSGSGNAQVKFNVTKNTGFSREGTITVKAKDGSIQTLVVVKQAGNSAAITITPNSIEIGAGAQKTKVQLKASESWYIISPDPWYTVSPRSGSGNAEITIDVTKNPYTYERTSNIRVYSTRDNIERATLKLVQEESTETSKYLYLNLSEINFSNSANDQQSFIVSSNTSWSIYSCPSWLKLSTSSGSYNSTVYATTNSSNTSGTTRTGYIRVKSSDGKTASIYVTQGSSTSSNSVVTPTNIVTLKDAIALDFNFSSSVYKFQYLMLSKSVADSYSTTQIMSMVKDQTIKYASDYDGYFIYYTGMNPSTSYVFYCVGINYNGEYGALKSTTITTKNSSNTAYTEISDVIYSYASGEWQWSTTKNSSAQKFYMVEWQGTESDLDNVYGKADIVVAWLMNQRINKYPSTDGKLYTDTNADWTWNRSNSSYDHLVLATWSMNSSSSLAGIICNYAGYLSSNTQSETAVQKSEPQNSAAKYGEQKEHMHKIDNKLLESAKLHVVEISK